MKRVTYKKIYVAFTLCFSGMMIGFFLNEYCCLPKLIIGFSGILIGVGVWFNKKTWFDK